MVPKKLLLGLVSSMLVPQCTQAFFNPPPPPPLIRQYLEPTLPLVSAPPAFLKSTGQLLFTIASLLANKRLAATTAAAIAAGLSVYYLYSHADQVAKVVELGAPLVGTGLGAGASLFAERMFSRGHDQSKPTVIYVQPQAPAQPTTPATKPVSKKQAPATPARAAQQAPKKAPQAPQEKEWNKLLQEAQEKEKKRKLEEARRKARAQEAEERKQQKELEKAWHETQPKSRTSVTPPPKL